MKLKILCAFVLAVLTVLVVVSQIKQKAFAPAEDFPREALIYVQIADLPSFIKLWNDSDFRAKYLESQNFDDLTHRHLGLKLASRWQEFNDAAGFPLDLEMFGGLTENQAAVAVYDIGKLDFVLIAPISDELFAATKFAAGQDKFTTETLDDGTEIYRVNVEADRGRQKQELIFTHAKGKFVLATSVKLLAQTITNINGKIGKNSLSDEPGFKILNEQIEPHTATVWVNQTALNEDYYFKRYWLMSDASELKNIRAGIFDFSAENGKLIEHRKFLLAQPTNLPSISNDELAKSLTHLPENVPFYTLAAADNQKIDAAIRETVFDRQGSSQNSRQHQTYYFGGNYYADSPNYSSLNEDFDQTIDETDEANDDVSKTNKTNLAQLLTSAQPRTILTFAQPQVLPAPLFVEFQRAAVFTFDAPQAFNRQTFESALEKNLSSQILISTTNSGLEWTTKNENNQSWRELVLPMTEWKISYTIRGNELFLANDGEFLQKVLAAQNGQNVEQADSSFSELKVLNLDQKETAFDQVFDRLTGKDSADDFFSGNISSFLESISKVKTIKIKKSYRQNFRDEEIELNYAGE